MKKTIKYLIISIIYICVLPFGGLAKLFHLATRSSFFFDMFGQLVALAPGVPGKLVRLCYYHQTLAESHLDAEFCFGALITKIGTRIGRGVAIGLNTSVGFAEIGDYTVIANTVSVLSGARQHNFDDPDQPIFSRTDTFSRVKIGRNTFIGDQVVVMADIGSSTVVGAGSIVNQPVPDYVVAVGNPVRVIKKRRSPRADSKIDHAGSS